MSDRRDEVGAVPVQPGAAYPVEAIVFPEGSADGAVMETGTSIDMSADVMFEVDSAELTPRADDELGTARG